VLKRLLMVTLASDLPHLFGPGTALVIHDTGALASARV
jgi:hypothetical protein